ncbi:IclR family transcriptional regulator [Geodermatophilus sp. YIM 151500]|uniref:IclR family transcriptional regulator n=1 Tax=Geodermatophilus sp. YIM 151500 TaxID=2984531 RepID=UPI0021E3CD17|nr:IclR family transcriptional regulator [Geodermatophilus sp. YIM 151500]MCV2491167.1 IclR family transcriptional regulator [Geodermatophilus sp. YIM 151500]
MLPSVEPSRTNRAGDAGGPPPSGAPEGLRGGPRRSGPVAGDGAPGRSAVQSIDRAVTILRCFDARRPTLGISDIARATGLSTTTTHRILAAMQANHLVRQTSDRRYGLGPLLVQLAHSGALPTTLRDAAMPLMTQLRDEVDETVGLHELLPSGERVVVDQVESHQEVRRTYTDIGVPIPLPHGAPGKAILSTLPPAEQDYWLSRPIRSITARTITDPEALRADLAATRERGWADSRSERTSGIRAVAAPIFDHTGKPVGALGLSVPEFRMDDDRARHLGERARQTAWLVSETLGATAEAVAETLRRAGGA